MPKKLNPSEVYERVENTHGSSYEYKYFYDISLSEKIDIKCVECGHKFTQLLDAHIKGQGCRLCGLKKSAKKRKRTNSEFIRLCVDYHGDKYDYSKTKYTLSTKHVVITCRTHGDFKQIANNHISGQGCPHCADCAKLSMNEFLRRSILSHGNKYDYSKTVYVNSHTKVCITCKKHGDFYVMPYAHTSTNQGCYHCGKESMSNKNKVKFSDFLSRSIKHHGNYYKYIESTFIGSDSDIKIVCPEHGEFSQRAISHMNGHGCAKCGRNLNGFSRSNFKNLCDKNNNGSGTLYLIKCWNDDESFFKIGITSHKNVKARFHGKFMPYHYEFVDYITDDGNKIYDLETEAHRMLVDFKYIPTIEFKGMGECFNDVSAIDSSLQMVLNKYR